MGFSRARFQRFLKPESIAVYGGVWARNVIQQLQRSGYKGEIWPVHPRESDIEGLVCYSSTDHLPTAPDAAFIGVNRSLSIEVVGQLSERGAGGAICFASGFREADNGQNLDGDTLQNQLIECAQSMPLLGPNCYGFLNYLDNVMVWPDQHGGKPVDSGVAIIAQSSNVAINMTMQRRGLPLAYMFTVGNQACVSLSTLADLVLDDSRVTTIGLFIEGFGDVREFESMVQKAKARGKSIVALKLGKSAKAQQAAMTHTATLAGGATASTALLKRLGIVEVDSITSFIESLTLLHMIGPLNGSRISSVSCSGGEASLVADAAHKTILEFPSLDAAQQDKLLEVLGEKVTLANPLDYHTYIWGDVPTMVRCFAAVMQGDFDLNVFVLDLPREDHCDNLGHRCAIDAIIQAKQASNAKVVVVASIPENISEHVTAEFHDAGIGVLHGLKTGIDSIVSAVIAGRYQREEKSYLPVSIAKDPSSPGHQVRSLFEAQAKQQLANYGLPVPKTLVVGSKREIAEMADRIEFPVVLKAQGLEHKTESGAVIVGIQDKTQLFDAMENLPNSVDGYVVEQMIEQALAELIIGVSKDPTGLLLLTIGAGGILTELLSDSVSVLMPSSLSEIDSALGRLKINKLLQGYRGNPAVDRAALINAILAIQAYVLDHTEELYELDINPLIVRQHGCCAVDALIRLKHRD